jgi:hypothetical protein
MSAAFNKKLKSKTILMSFPLVGNLSSKPERIADTERFRDNDKNSNDVVLLMSVLVIMLNIIWTN